VHLCRRAIVQALVQTFMIVETEVGLQSHSVCANMNETTPLVKSGKIVYNGYSRE